MRVARRRTVNPDHQRFLGVLDTSPFRIAIVYSIVFACGAATLLGAVDFAVSRVVDGSTDNLIEAEVQGLREQVLVLSRSDFIELIEQRSQDQDVRGAVYLMVDPQLRPVAGNVPAWPKIDANEGKWIQFKVSVPFGDEIREHDRIDDGDAERRGVQHTEEALLIGVDGSPPRDAHYSSSRKLYPAPRTVCSRGLSKSSSIAWRRRLMCTSMTLVWGSK